MALMKMGPANLWRWLLLAVLCGVILFAPLPAWNAAPTDRTFRIKASRFEYSPAVLQVNPGDRVTIELEAIDVVHGLAIDGSNQSVSADPGQIARLSFVAGRQGSFRFRCTVTCGSLHPFMIGKLQVGQNTLLIRAGLLAVLAVAAAGCNRWM
jgi:heme/copper-type cytochrome/quinol oxidase subunit 2